MPLLTAFAFEMCYKHSESLFLSHSGKFSENRACLGSPMKGRQSRDETQGGYGSCMAKMAAQSTSAMKLTGPRTIGQLVLL